MRCLHLLLFVTAPFCALAQKAGPELIVPKKGDRYVESEKLSRGIPPMFLDGLRELRPQLTAYFSMEAKLPGGLTWSRTPIGVGTSDLVEAKEADGRKYLDFSVKGSVARFNPPLKMGAGGTICAWVKLPGPTSHALVWQGPTGDYLRVDGKKICCWSAATTKFEDFAEATEILTGWHHLALVKTGKKVQAFMDGKPLAVVTSMVFEELTHMGNHKDLDDQMVPGIDEQYIFRKALTPAEVTAVMEFSKKEAGKR